MCFFVFVKLCFSEVTPTNLITCSHKVSIFTYNIISLIISFWNKRSLTYLLTCQRFDNSIGFADILIWRYKFVINYHLLIWFTQMMLSHILLTFEWFKQLTEKINVLINHWFLNILLFLYVLKTTFSIYASISVALLDSLDSTFEKKPPPNWSPGSLVGGVNTVGGDDMNTIPECTGEQRTGSSFGADVTSGVTRDDDLSELRDADTSHTTITRGGITNKTSTGRN